MDLKSSYISLERLLAIARDAEFTIHEVFYSPKNYFCFISACFENSAEEDQTEIFVNKLNKKIEENSSYNIKIMSVEDVGNIETLSASTFLFLRNENEKPFFLEEDHGIHWLSLIKQNTKKNDSHPKSVKDPQVIHFYGYKGGQARSTFLTEVAQCLIERGKNVLAVDSDIESSSFSTLFNSSPTNISQTLLAASIPKFEIEPQLALVNSNSGGKLFLFFASMHSDSKFKYENSALGLRMHTQPQTLKTIVSQVKERAKSIKNLGALGVDFLLVDHRTGISDFVLPWISKGDHLVLFARPDGQWKEGIGSLKDLSRLFEPKYFTLVSFIQLSADEILKKNHKKVLFAIQEELQSLESELYPDNDSDDQTVEQSRILWARDPKFISNESSLPVELDQLNAEALIEFVDKLGVTFTPNASPSGANDERPFVHTNWVQELEKNSGNCFFIFGRKGTGKTRLVRHMLETKPQYMALLSDSQISNQKYGLKPEVFVRNSIKNFLDNNDGGHAGYRFWLKLISLAMAISDEEFSSSVEDFLVQKNWSIEDSNKNLKNTLLSSTKFEGKVTFAIESLETSGLPQNELNILLEGLCFLIRDIASDATLANKVAIHFYVRRDLVENCIVNFDQLAHNRSIDLRWSYKDFLNLFLLWIYCSKAWLEQFVLAKDVFKNLEMRRSDLESLKVPGKICEEIVTTQIFNQKNGKLKFIGFLRTYFNDTENLTSDNFKFHQGHYLPRVLDTFIEELSLEILQLNESQVSQNKSALFELFEQSYDKAAKLYATELKSELVGVFGNRVELDSFLSLMVDNLVTPFSLTGAIKTLSKAGMKIYEKNQIIEYLNAFLRAGVFEEYFENGEIKWRAAPVFRQGFGLRRKTAR